MNRHQRRAAAAQARQRAAFAAGQRAAQTGELPPGYIDCIRQLAGLILQWVREQTSPPHLVWHDMTDGPPEQNTILIGPLQGDSLKYVAGSPDAIRCLQWVDEQSGGVGSLYQATWALKMAGFLPLPPGLERDDIRSGFETARRFARAVNDARNKHAPSPCPHCGKIIDASGGGPDGAGPSPGALSVCLYCQGVSQYGGDLTLRPFAEIDRLPEDVRRQIEDLQAILRQAHLQAATGAKKTPVEA
jgi:hypothetical protein